MNEDMAVVNAGSAVRGTHEDPVWTPEACPLCAAKVPLSAAAS